MIVSRSLGSGWLISYTSSVAKLVTVTTDVACEALAFTTRSCNLAQTQNKFSVILVKIGMATPVLISCLKVGYNTSN